MEHIGGKWSVIYGIGFQLPWALAYCILPGMAYAIPNWFYLQLIISIPSVVYPIIALVIPESGKWFLSKGHNDKAERVLRKVAKVHRRDWPIDQKLLSVVGYKQLKRIF